MKKYLFLALTLMILSAQNTWSTPTKQEVYELAKYWYSFDNHGIDSISDDTLVVNNVSFVSDGERGLVAQLTQSATSGMESTKKWVQGEEYSVASWIYVDMDTYPEWNQIWEFHNDGTGDYHMLTGKIAWGHHYGAVFSKNDPKLWQNVHSKQIFPLKRWVHVVMSFNYGNVALYLDGAEVGSGNTGNLVESIAPNRFFIGGFDITGRKGNGLNCKMDDFAVFDYVLTPDEVTALSKDTLAASPDVAPYVFEVEDYALGDWANASEADTTYTSWTGDVQNEASDDNSMLFGVAKGVGTFVLWAKVKSDAGIKAPLFLKIDEGNWISIDTVTPKDKYTWVKLYQTPNLQNGDHTFQIAPGAGGLKIDKFLYTRDWDYNPVTEFTKTDMEAPTVPSSLTTSNVTVHSGTLSWNASTDNSEVTAYDVYESGKMIAVTTSLSQLFDAMAFSDYSLQVRAKDAQGNVSALSAAKDISTDDLIFTIDFNQEKQTVHHFGASDAWAVDNLYKWPLAKRQDMAEKLFTTENDAEGNPKGIGLSMWRFHIGDGSLDQANSGYASGGWYKELECFRAENGTYDWNKQKGSMWFMQQAKSYGVNSYTAWINSPPYYMTENGYTFRTDGVDGYNLQPDKFDDFAEFLATVAKHLTDSGYNVEVVSPVNEPQFQWKWKVGEAAQSGSYCSNADLYTLGFNLNAKLKQKGLSTKIMLTEAASLGPLFKNTGNAAHSEQIDYFWNNSNPTSLRQLSNMGSMVAGHSYWINGTVDQAVSYRNSVRDKLSSLGGLEYWQTEYSILGEDHRDGRTKLKEMEYSTWLSRIIHMDMTEGDCASWSFWTAFTRAGENSDHRWRFGLFWWIPDVIDHTNTDGEYYAMKNLWTLGNYSRFIRPESKRMHLTRSDGKTFKESAYYEFASAYYTQDTSQVVVVVTNYAGNNQKVKLNVTNLVPGLSISEFTPYLTSDTTNLKKMPVVNSDAVINLPAMSIMTLVAEIEGEVSGLEEIYSTSRNAVSFTVIPNPANDYVTLRFNNETNGYFIVSDLSGKVVLNNQLNGTLTEIINLEEFESGIYIIKVFRDGITEYQKLLVN